MTTFADLGIDLPFGARGEIRAQCPKCSGSRKPGHQREKDLAVNVEEGVYHCHHCDWKGTIKSGGGHGVRIKSYERPRPIDPAPQVIQTEMLKWFGRRGISSEVVERNWITAVAGQNSWIAFPYYRDGEHINTTYRGLHAKTFRQEKDAERIFWGLDDITPEMDTVIIVEGQMDKLAFEMAGYSNVLSVPDGAINPGATVSDGKLAYLAASSDLLTRMRRVFLACDRDAPGQALNLELARRIGREKCWLVEWPAGQKDANDALLEIGPTGIQECMERAQPFPVVPEAGQAIWPICPPEAFHGLAGDLVRAFEPHTEADPVATLVTTLTMAGNLAGRHAHIYIGETRHGTNENVALAGATSRGRKGTSAAPPKRVLSTVDPDWLNNRVLDGIGSGEGLIWAVRDRNGDDPGVEDKRLLNFEEELTSNLTVSGRDGSTAGEVYRKAWDGPTVLHNVTKKSPAKATDAHISVIGHVTISEVRRKLTAADKANGVGNRFCWFCVRRSKQLPLPAPLPPDTVRALAKRFAAVIGTDDQGQAAVTEANGRFEFSESARSLYSRVYPSLTRDLPGLFGALVARGEAHVVRWAMIYALLDGGRTVTPQHLLAALALWQYAEQSARYIWAESTGDLEADMILEALRQSGPLTRTQISDLFDRNRNAGRIDGALRVLREAGLATSEKAPANEAGGRPPTLWHALDHTPDADRNYLSVARAFCEENERNEITPSRPSDTEVSSFLSFSGRHDRGSISRVEPTRGVVMLPPSLEEDPEWVASHKT